MTIFQACRGTKHEIPVPPAQDVVDGPMADEDDEFHTVVVDSGPTPTLPSASDFLFCYSVAEGENKPKEKSRCQVWVYRLLLDCRRELLKIFSKSYCCQVTIHIVTHCMGRGMSRILRV